MRENADQNNSEYGHFLRSDKQWIIQYISTSGFCTIPMTIDTHAYV